MSEPMRILSVRQPWASAILNGGKDVENRFQNIAGAYRGRVAIHASRTVDDDGFADPRIVRAINGGAIARRMWTGGILGVVDLVDVHFSRESLADTFKCLPTCFDSKTPTGQLCSPWAQCDPWGVYHLVLANPRQLSEPIPYKGALGLRVLPAEAVARIEEQL